MIGTVLIALSLSAEPAAYADVAKTITAGSSPDAVKEKTAAIGDPELKYSWCNGAACVPSRADAEATAMTATWPKKDGRSLVVMFCRVRAEWRVAAVYLLDDGKPGAWGTAAAPKKTYVVMDDEIGGRCSR